jgi:hypothetical protein
VRNRAYRSLSRVYARLMCVWYKRNGYTEFQGRNTKQISENEGTDEVLEKIVRKENIS